MRAVRLLRFAAPLVDADVRDREAGAGEVRIEIRAAGICHSDAHYRAGGGQVTLPVTLGHEIAGVTDAGDRVAVHYLLRDGSMFGKEVDGGYAESIIVPRENLVPIPDQVPFEEAAVMMCSTATAFHALRLASLEPGESVAILGFGGLGASAVQLAHGLGAGDIFAVDRVAQKRDVAKQFGAIPISGDLPPIDIAVDFAGNANLCRAALRALKPGGRLMIVAINLRALSFDPYADVLVRERRIIGVSDHTREELVELMELARSGRIDLSRVITRRVALNAAAINEVLDDLDRGTAHLRTVIEMGVG
jgi:2-desacetyl-2-hydroxyethyl bacteriochlorophyllide A dehydrogenase